MAIPSFGGRRLRLDALRFGLLLSLGALAACNATIDLDDGTGGSTATSTSTPTSTSSGGAVCDAFQDEAAAGTETFKVHNDSGVPAYFKVECGQPVYSVATNQEGTFPGARACLSTCEDLRTTDPPDCAACAPQSLRVEPGGTLTISWDGLGLRDEEMPAGCFKTPSLAPSCQQLVSAPLKNIYSFSISAYSACGNGQPCDCDASGLCNGLPSGTEVGFSPDQGEFTHGSGNGAELTLPNCAFGCPTAD